MSSQSAVPLVEVTRGYKVESIHRGAIAAVDSAGHLVASAGQASQPTYLRSAAKPFQALALVCSGAADAFGLTEEELAIVCASHGGEPRQVSLVESVLAKTGIEASELRCGIHPPFDREARRRLLAEGREPTALHNNCSGKHAGMLAVARYLDLDRTGYLDPKHGVQVAILGLLAYLCGLDTEEIGIAIDGCSAPTHFLPMRAFSLALARLAAEGSAPDPEADSSRDPDASAEADPSDHDRRDPSGFDETFPVSLGAGLRRIWNAMRRHPELIAGTGGRICTDLMRTAADFDIPLIAKSGAEGVYACAVGENGTGIGLTLKIEDGAERARNAALLESLFQLDLLPEEAEGPLAGYHRQVVMNHQRLSVGEIRPSFRLSRGLRG